MFTPSPLKNEHLAKCFEIMRTPLPEKDPQGLPARTWSAMPHRTRAVLVMLGGASMEDPKEVARRPWGSLSEADRVGIAACARELGRDLRDAACLF